MEGGWLCFWKYFSGHSTVCRRVLFPFRLPWFHKTDRSILNRMNGPFFPWPLLFMCIFWKVIEPCYNFDLGLLNNLQEVWKPVKPCTTFVYIMFFYFYFIKKGNFFYTYMSDIIGFFASTLINTLESVFKIQKVCLPTPCIWICDIIILFFVILSR